MAMENKPNCENFGEESSLQRKAEENLAELVLLIDHIKQWQAHRHNQLWNISNAITCQMELQKAQTHLQEMEDWLRNLLHRAGLATKAAPKHFESTLKQLQSHNDSLDTEVLNWKIHLRHALMGGPTSNMETGFVRLKQYFETLENFACSLLEQIDRSVVIIEDLKNLYPENGEFQVGCGQLAEDCQRWREQVQVYLINLVQKGTIVYQQPPPVVQKSENLQSKRPKKSNIPFTAEIRFCAGEKSGLLKANTEIEAVLISERSARDMVLGAANALDRRLVPAGEVNYATCLLKLASAATRSQTVASMSDIRVQVKESAAEDDRSRVKYHLLFRAKASKRAADESFPFWAISLPFAVAINFNRQEKFKRALMFWQLAFQTDDRTSLSLHMIEKPSVNYDRVPWPEFFQALNWWFRKTAQTERGIEEHEAYIQEKLNLKETSKYMDNYVSWEMFYKKKSDASLTFWEYILPIADYISKSPQFWQDGLILGFASRTAVEYLLKSAASPEYMVLKFSDSRPGKMVASYLDIQTGKVEHTIFDEKQNPVFEDRPLGECIRISTNLKQVTTLLPSKKHVMELHKMEKAQPPAVQKNDGYLVPTIEVSWGIPPSPPTYPGSASSGPGSFQGSETDSMDQPYSMESDPYPDIRLANMSLHPSGSLSGSETYDFNNSPNYNDQSNFSASASAQMSPEFCGGMYQQQQESQQGFEQANGQNWTMETMDDQDFINACLQAFKTGI